jgi:preprotein translocase subunit SecD
MKTLLLSVMLVLIGACSSAEDKIAKEGGYSFLLSVQGRMDDDGNEIPFSEQEVDQAIHAVEGRLEGMGIAEILVTPELVGTFRIKVPGVGADEAARISAMLEKTSRLGLHEVSPLNDEANAEGITLAQRVQDGDEIVPGFRARTLKGKDAEGNDYEKPILINRRMALGGEDIAIAVVSPHQPDSVNITLNGRGTDKMIAFTKTMRPSLDRIAIVLDGEVLSAPIVMQTPLGKNFVISGLGKPWEAKSLAISLMHPFENSLKVKEVRRIPPAGK